MKKPVSLDELDPDQQAKVRRMRHLIQSGRYNKGGRFFDPKTRRGLSEAVKSNKLVCTD